MYDLSFIGQKLVEKQNSPLGFAVQIVVQYTCTAVHRFEKIQQTLVPQVRCARFKELVIVITISKSKVGQGPAEALKQERPLDSYAQASVAPSMCSRLGKLKFCEAALRSGWDGYNVRANRKCSLAFVCHPESISQDVSKSFQIEVSYMLASL
jgi:hypothetical protein